MASHKETADALYYLRSKLENVNLVSWNRANLPEEIAKTVQELTLKFDHLHKQMYMYDYQPSWWV